MREPVLEVEGLCVALGGNSVVQDVSFTLHRSACIGIVGASGSGKTVTSLALMGLLPESGTEVSGTALLYQTERAIDLLELDAEGLRKMRGRKLAMVFQEPMTALDPVHTVGDQVEEAIRHHLRLDRNASRERVIALFGEVGLPIPEHIRHRYPHQLSGGQKQRVVIALALSCEPEVLICDEPTTALDVLVQREIMALLRRLQQEREMGMLFITHDLGVVSEVADHVMVMQQGRVVEHAATAHLFRSPQHPYTKGLLACRPEGERHPRRLPTVDEFLSGAFDPDHVELVADEQRRADLERLMSAAPLLEVTGLSKSFTARGGLFAGSRNSITVLEEIGFSVYPGESLGIVGGSGSGKTTLGRSILQLIRPGHGQVLYKGRDLCALSEGEMRGQRRFVQLIFQDPYASLNPQMTVGRAILEAMQVHGVGADDRDRKKQILALLERVDLSAEHFGRYPHQFSGGQRQRIVIARTMALGPELVICDESVSALDVSVQAQVLNLLNDLKDEYGLTYLFISHDLNVVRYFCDRIMVLDKGRIAEIGPSPTVYADPQAEATKRLLAAIPGRSV